jgi:hypothetical protein
VSRPSRRARTAPLLLLAATVGPGCEYFRDTLEQELANRRWRECAGGVRDVKLDRVDADGRIRFTYVGRNEADRVTACLEAAGRDGARLPDPAASLAAGK